MSVYRNYTPEQYEEHFSNFLINSWSYSKVSAFARNQLAFEMQYIFGIYGRSGANTMAGKAYHKALEVYFSQLKDGVHTTLPELDACAFQHLEEIPPNFWKLGKTTPTMEQAMEQALKTSNNLLKNFYSELYSYNDDIAEVLEVECKFSEWLTINGVDIPLPCNGIIDLVIRTKKDKIAVVDHKSKTAYTDEKEASLAIGPQAIIYALAYEAKAGITVDEIWFMENKPSQNKDKTAQIKPIKVDLDANTRKLYELLLYGNLRQMISAVKDPDYVYTVNLADNLVDMAELMDFWSRVQICEVEDFNVEEGKKELVSKRLKKVRDANVQMIPPQVIKAFREKAATFIQYDYSVLNMTPQETIEHVYRTNSIIARVAHTFEGYSSNTFLLEVSTGVKIDSLYKYKLDVANALNVPQVRMPKQLTVHEGRSYVSIEYAKKRDKNLLFNPADRKGMKLPVGKDNYGNVIYWDLANHSTPHALICGATGSGKSVEVRSLIKYAKDAGVREIIILDPKDEFGHLYGDGTAVLSDILEIEEAMAKCVEEMNQRVKSKRSDLTLIVFDEYADAIMNARKPKELKTAAPMVLTARGLEIDTPSTPKTLGENLQLLLQKGRSAGFRIVAATQRASVKIITGDTKVNFPVQICFRVPKAADSIVVLDEAGAEALAGAGDGLIRSPEYPDLIRFQAYFTPQNQHV